MCNKNIVFEPGDVIFLKKSVVKKYGFNPSFIKKGNRPFVIGKITEYGAFWVVPSYSNCSDYSEITKKYYQKVYTPDGECKYLKFRDMIVIEKADISGKRTSGNIISLSSEEILDFKKKFIKIRSLLQSNRPFFESNYYAPFIYEKNIVCEYLRQPYLWLERDFNIVDQNRNFNPQVEICKTDFADALYYSYLKNLKYFLISRNKYLPIRKNECFSYFHMQKIEFVYKCYTNNGYILSLNPLCYTDSFNDAAKIREDDLQQIKEDYVYEPISSEAPLLNAEEEKKIASELIWLDNNIVSQKTYYDVYGKLPGKQEIKSKIEDAKRKSV